MMAYVDPKSERDPQMAALRRWLDGQDGALEEWLNGRVRPIRRRTRTIAGR